MTPSMLNLPAGCAFRARCPRAEARCAEPPPMAEYRPGRFARCIHPHEEAVRRMSEALDPPRAAALDCVPIIELRGVSKRFSNPLDFAGRLVKRLGVKVRDDVVHAVDGVDLSVRKGEVVGLVGESGCGKSTLGRMVAGIMPPSDGTVIWRGRDLTTLSGADAKRAKLRTQMIFQDPYASLNPRLKVAEIVGEAPQYHGLVPRGGLDTYVDEQLRRAGLDPALKRRYPHQFSGGQRQRIGIARALAVQPDFLVCDEAVAALDVSIQAQILNLFMKLRRELDLTYLFISHDLGVVEHLSRPRGDHVSRPGGRGSALRGGLRPAQPPLHARPAGRGAADRGAQARLRRGAGEIPSPLNPPSRLPFPPALPLRLRPLQGRAAGAEAGGTRASQRLPPERRGMSRAVAPGAASGARCLRRRRGQRALYRGAAGGNAREDSRLR